MDGAWRRPPKSLADYGHTEPKRGAEWWGKSALLTFALFESEPPSGRNPRWPLPQQWICTRYNGVACEAAFASKPAPTFLIVGFQVDRYRLVGRHRRQASSHIFDRGVSGGWTPAGRPPSQVSQPPSLNADHQKTPSCHPPAQTPSAHSHPGLPASPHTNNNG